MGTFPTSSSTGTLGDFTVSPEFHTHNHMLPGAIDMAALTALATSETVNTDVLQLVLSHQVSMTKMVNEAAAAAGALQMKADAAKREHELAICDRVMTSLPVVLTAARDMMRSPADTAEVISALDEVQKELKSAQSHRIETDLMIAIVRKEQADLLSTIMTAMNGPMAHPAPSTENGKRKSS